MVTLIIAAIFVDNFHAEVLISNEA